MMPTARTMATTAALTELTLPAMLWGTSEPVASEPEVLDEPEPEPVWVAPEPEPEPEVTVPLVAVPLPPLGLGT